MTVKLFERQCEEPLKSDDQSSEREELHRNKSMTYLKLNHFTQQPHWLRDNHYLHNNHRAPTESYIMCLRSCFMLHTETMNIW